MPQVNDPVCGMTIDSAKAAGQSNYQGQSYYFCSMQCEPQFDASPSKFASAPNRPGPEGRPSP